MKITSPRFHTPIWCDLQSPNPEGARHFYGRLLGWTFDLGGPETGHYAMAQRDGAQVAGIGGMPPESAGMPSTWTLYWGVQSAAAAVEAIRAQGGAVLVPPMQVLDYGHMAICADPCGAVFGLWQPGLHRGAGLLGEAGALSWQEVNVREGQRALDFYGAVFGLEHSQLPGMEYWLLSREGANAAGVLQMDQHWPPEVPAHWMIYFGVDELDAALALVGDLGGGICVPPFDTPYGRMAVVNDPHGATFTLIRLRQPI